MLPPQGHPISSRGSPLTCIKLIRKSTFNVISPSSFKPVPFTFYFLLFPHLLYRKLAPSTLSSLLSILFPSIFLGLATSIRILGPLAGLLIALYAFRKYGVKAIPTLLIYAFFALAAMYATWPYLWPNPIGHLIESLRVMSQYPWPGQVLFNGVEYASTEIPRSYLPILLGLQLTEPVWILFFVGLAVAGWGFVKRAEIRRIAGADPGLVYPAADRVHRLTHAVVR